MSHKILILIIFALLSSTASSAICDCVINTSVAEPQEIDEKDIVIYVGNGEPARYIDGAVHIAREDFVIDGNILKKPQEIGALLGSKGISNNDSVVVYGSCMTCGDPTYIYWILSYLGQERVRVLDGGIGAWRDAGLPVDNTSASLPPARYIPLLRSDLLASYDYVKSGEAQIVDARTPAEFDEAHIPGAINLDSSLVLDGDSFKNESELAALFQAHGLNISRPVVVYTLNGGKASIVWFALDLLGYNARLYTWMDWGDHQPGFELKGLLAEPNPSAPGPVKITANIEILPAKAALSTDDSGNNTLVTMGCVTCEPITAYTGGSLGQNKTEGLRLGNYSSPGVRLAKTEEASVPAITVAPPISGMKVLAIVRNSTDFEAGRVELKPVSKSNYTGTWDASAAAPGTYNVSLVVSAPGLITGFMDRLTIGISMDAASGGSDGVIGGTNASGQRFTKLSKY